MELSERPRRPFGESLGPVAGTRAGMRFKLGMAVGFAAGYWVGSTSAEERRAKLDGAWEAVRGNPRLQRVTDTVTRDVHRLGDAVEQRFVDTTDGAIGAIAGTVDTADTTSDTTRAESGKSRADASRAQSA